MTAKHMTEEQAVLLVRNALLAAGHEMGKDGDHWPVIKSTIYNIAKDYEDYRIERNVFDELKVQYGDIVAKMEKDLELCPAELRSEADKIVRDIRESYEACFADVDMTMFVVCDADQPIYVKRVKTIVKALEDVDG